MECDKTYLVLLNINLKLLLKLYHDKYTDIIKERKLFPNFHYQWIFPLPTVLCPPKECQQMHQKIIFKSTVLLQYYIIACLNFIQNMLDKLLNFHGTLFFSKLSSASGRQQ